VGTFDYQPNRDAAAFLAARAPAVLAGGIERIVIAGRAAATLPEHVRGTTGVEIHSDVPDMESLFTAQDLLVVPLLNGGGVRVKVLEAWALGVPVVSTAVGIEGLGATSGVAGLGADVPVDLVALVAAAADPAVRTALAGAGWQRWHDHFTPKAFAAGVDRLARQATAERQAPVIRTAVPSFTRL
jgi:glycosyltransferase involved in cell wall biosynthesis